MNCIFRGVILGLFLIHVLGCAVRPRLEPSVRDLPADVLSSVVAGCPSLAGEYSITPQIRVLSEGHLNRHLRPNAFEYLSLLMGGGGGRPLDLADLGGLSPEPRSSQELLISEVSEQIVVTVLAKDGRVFHSAVSDDDPTLCREEGFRRLPTWDAVGFSEGSGVNHKFYSWVGLGTEGSLIVYRVVVPLHTLFPPPVERYVAVFRKVDP